MAVRITNGLLYELDCMSQTLKLMANASYCENLGEFDVAMTSEELAEYIEIRNSIKKFKHKLESRIKDGNGF